MEKSPQSWLPRVRGTPIHVANAAPGSEPIQLRTTESPLGKLIVLVCFAAFWNGIVSIFVTEVARSWIRGRPDACLTVFMIPFVAVGAALIGGVVYQVLACLNPRLDLVVSRASIPLGQPVTVAWQVRGRYERIENLRIWLEGREQATYRRGTNTATDKSVFAKISIAEATTAAAIHHGKASIRLPEGTMHSFKANNNRIVWLLVVHGQIPKWPDLKQEFELVVLPQTMSEVLA